MTTTFARRLAAAAALVVTLAAGSAGVASAVGPGSPVPSSDATTATPAQGSSGAPWWTLAAAGLVGLALGAGACYAVVGGTGARRLPAPAPTTPASTAALGARPAPPAAPAPDTAAFDAMVVSVIEARDLVDPSTVLSARLGAALASAGVSEFAPVGQRFDETRHHAVQAAPTSDPANVDLIAEVQRIGYYNQHQMIRLPEVVVYRMVAVT